LCGWLEYFADAGNAKFFAAAIEDVENLIVRFWRQHECTMQHFGLRIVISKGCRVFVIIPGPDFWELNNHDKCAGY